MFTACARLAAPDRAGRGQRGPGHQRGRLVHAREDRVVRGAEPVPAVGQAVPARLAHRVDVLGVVHQLELGHRRGRRGHHRHVRPVQQAERAGQRDRQLDPHRGQRMTRAEVVPGQALVPDQRERAARMILRPEFPAAVAGRLDRRQERGAHPVLLQLPDRRDRGAPGRGDGLAQDHRVLAGLAEHGGRAVDRLDDHLQRGAARHAEQDAGVHHRLDQVVHVRRAAAGQRGRGVLLRLGDAQHLADREEQFLGPLAGAPRRRGPRRR